MRCDMSDKIGLYIEKCREDAVIPKYANDGDAERAQRYMEFAKDCNLSFSPRLRNYQINSVVNVVEKNSHDILTRADLTLKIAVGVIALLLITLIMMCIKRKKQK